MKKITLVALALFSFSISASAFRQNLTGKNNVHVQRGGCDYLVIGWVDINLSSNNIEHCDLMLSGPCGKFHFTASVVNSGGNSGATISDPLETHLTDLSTGDDVDDPEMVKAIEQTISDPALYPQG